MSGCHPSTTKRTPDGVSPRSSRSASPAWTAPTMGEAGLKMPGASRAGSLPGGGAFGLKQRKRAVPGVRLANAILYVARAPPYTNGTFASIAVSLSKNRVSRLSVPSTTMSVSRRRSRTVAEWTSFESGSISICEFTERRRSAAASAFGRSTSDSEYSDCRWRFVSSTTSRSTSRRCPTPARASRSEEMLPKAPKPITTARARASSRWPFTPISGRTSCRRYRLGDGTRHQRTADLWPFAPQAVCSAGSLGGDRSDAVNYEGRAKGDRTPPYGKLIPAEAMSIGDFDGFNGVCRTVRVADDGERTRPAREGLHDFDDPHARSRRREPPLLVPDGGFRSRVCPGNCGSRRPPRLGFVLSRSDGEDAPVEPDGLRPSP